MFQSLDATRRRKLDYQTFATACAAFGYHTKPQTVASAFDSHERRHVEEEDFYCIDIWKPPAWLVAKASSKAAHDFRSQCINKYGRFVKAWRLALDKDSTNNCNW